MISQVGSEHKYEINKTLGFTKPYVLIGGETGKFVPNLNMSFECFSGQEQYFINLNAGNIIVNQEVETFDGTTLELTVAGITLQWIEEEGKLNWKTRAPVKPIGGIIELDMICSPELEFYYQPHEVTEGGIRPEEVKGSYAVYCNQTGNFSNVKYYAGKVGHFYRPKIMDSSTPNPDEIWAELYISKAEEVFRVTIDDDWLNQATYPITVV